MADNYARQSSKDIPIRCRRMSFASHSGPVYSSHSLEKPGPHSLVMDVEHVCRINMDFRYIHGLHVT
jgi:hypothetical protein